MLLAATILMVIATLIHFALMIAEIFFWKQPIIHERLGFNLTEATKAAAIVQMPNFITALSPLA